MLLTAITACHDDLGAVESCEQLFELLDQFLAVQSLMLLTSYISNDALYPIKNAKLVFFPKRKEIGFLDPDNNPLSLDSVIPQLLSNELFIGFTGGRFPLYLISKNGDYAVKASNPHDIYTEQSRIAALSLKVLKGIGAFEGAEDEALAFNAAKSADLIMFLITDDAPQAIEGDCFSRIVKLGKPVICVMNVKAAVNPERSPKMIERTIKGRFDIERLDSIKNQFLQYAKKAGQEWSNIPFVYVHLKAAFMSQSISESNPDFSERLYELSCIDSLKQLLVDCVRENGVFYRTKTFIDIIDNP